MATLTRRLASISQAHQLAGYTSPAQSELVRTRLKGIWRIGDTLQDRAAVTVEMLRAVLTSLPHDCAGLRDRALLLIGFAGAFRCSELVGLDCADVQIVPEGLIVTLRAALRVVVRGRCSVCVFVSWWFSDSFLWRSVDLVNTRKTS